MGLFSTTLLFALAAAMLVSVSAIGEANRIMLSGEEFGKHGCLDRSAYGFYYRKAMDPTNNDKWVIFAGDNGICTNNSDCKARFADASGSSKNWPSTMMLSGLQDVDDTHNSFATWNAIFLPDCSGDAFMGTAKYHEPMFNYGGHNIRSAMKYALAKLPVPSASKVILGGKGYGGLGMASMADFLADLIGEAATLNNAMEGLVGRSGPEVYLVNIGGSASRQNVTYEGTTPAPEKYIPFSDTHFSSLQAYWSALVNEGCRNKHPYSYDRGFCGFAPWIYESIKTPTFMVQSQYDNHYIGSYTGLPKDLVQAGGNCFGSFSSCPNDAKKFLFSWSTNEIVLFEKFFEAAADPLQPHGAFSAGCMMHDEFSSTSPLIKGNSYINAIDKWISNKGKGMHMHFDYCTPSNPLCGMCNI